jgi:hypothetical protein
MPPHSPPPLLLLAVVPLLVVPVVPLLEVLEASVVVP